MITLSGIKQPRDRRTSPCKLKARSSLGGCFFKFPAGQGAIGARDDLDAALGVCPKSGLIERPPRRSQMPNVDCSWFISFSEMSHGHLRVGSRCRSYWYLGKKDLTSLGNLLKPEEDSSYEFDYSGVFSLQTMTRQGV
jgi:hypothetical protein